MNTKITVVLIALSLFSSVADAGYIDFSGAVTGSQTLSGSNMSMPIKPFFKGERPSGFLKLDNSALMPGASFGNNDIQALAFSVGPTPIANTRTSVAGTIASDGRTLRAFSAFTGISSFADSCSVCLASIGLRSFYIEDFAPGSGRIVGNSFATIRGVSSPLPEPPEWAIFGLGDLGILVTSIKMRRD